MNLSDIIAWSKDLEAHNHADKNKPKNWTKEDFTLCQRYEYNTWKRYGVAASSSCVTTTMTATTSNSSEPSNNDYTWLNDFNKTSKNKTDYEILKNEEYLYRWKVEFKQ